METTRSLHIEDNGLLRYVIDRGLRKTSEGRHQVVAVAATLPEAQTALDEVGSGLIEANVVLLDNSLSDTFDAEDALALRQYIDILGLSVKVVGLGAAALEESGVRLDDHLRKSRYTAELLSARLDALETPAAVSY